MSQHFGCLCCWTSCFAQTLWQKYWSTWGENQRCQVYPEVHPQPRPEVFWNQDWTVLQDQEGYWTFGSLSICARTCPEEDSIETKRRPAKKLNKKWKFLRFFNFYTFSNSIAASELVCRIFMVKRIGSPQHFVVSKFTKISVKSDCRICISFKVSTMKTSPFPSDIQETLLFIFSLFFWRICEENRLYHVSSSKGENFKVVFLGILKTLVTTKLLSGDEIIPVITL